MSKQNNLTDFLTDVANAIRAKKGSTELINPQDFSSEIASLSGSGGLEIVDMTETTATIEPNKVYVWGMVESLDITLGASTDESDFFAFRFRCSKPTMTVVTVNGATWADDTELDAQGKPVLDPGSWYQCEIKGGTSALYARLAHYIPFEDSNVEAVLLAKGVGDGIGITYADAAKVTTISTWFQNNADITAFEEFAAFTAITDLIKYAFRYCSSLQRIKLPSSINKFSGDAVFEYCTALTEIYLPSALKSLASWTFNGCTLLAKIYGLENTQVTSIGSSAFNVCSALTEIAFPASLTSIGPSAFKGCKSLVAASGLENTQVTSIGSSAFNDCSALTEIAFPASLTSIGPYAFKGCKSLVAASGLENTQVTSIGDSAFNDCSALTEIAFPASLTSIGPSAFVKTKISGEYTFESMTTIGSRAFVSTNVSKMRFPSLVSSPASSNYEGIFSYCPNLILVEIGENCTSIGSNSFGRYVGTSGNDITFIMRATTPPTLTDRLISTQWVKAKIGVIYVPDESLETYKTATNWSYYADIIKPLSEYTE